MQLCTSRNVHRVNTKIRCYSFPTVDLCNFPGKDVHMCVSQTDGSLMLLKEQMTTE